MTDAKSLNEITETIISAAIAVHRALGPGLLESAYQACLCHELLERGVKVEVQKPIPLSYLRLTGCTVGLLINFHIKVLKNGIRRVVNGFPDPPPSPRVPR